MPVIHSKAYALRDRTTPKSLKILMWCEHCNGDGQIETDNNGPIVDCPVCDGEGVALKLVLAALEQEGGSDE